MSKTIPVVHCFDNNYVIPAAVAFLSMLTHASLSYHYKLYVLHTDITGENQQKLCAIVNRFKNASLEFINMKNKFEDQFRSLTMKAHYSKEVLYKLLLASLFPQYDHVIVTDVDVVYLGDISQGYNQFLLRPNDYIACIKVIMRPKTFLEDCYNGYKIDFDTEEQKKMDACGGYLIFNLKQIRDHKIEKMFLETLEKNLGRLLQAEQDVINLVIPIEKRFYLPLNSLVCSYAYDLYHDGHFEMDTHYSANEIKDALKNPIQLHYATSIKPWNTPDCTKADVWYFFLAQTPFFYSLIRQIKKESNFKVKYTFLGLPILTITSKKIKLFGIIPLKKK